MKNSAKFPMLDGVSPIVIYLEKINNKHDFPDDIFEFLCRKFAHISQSEWQRRFDDGLVFWEDGTIVNQRSPYVHGRSIYYYRFLDDEIVVPFENKIIFENQEFMVIDKPHFLTVTPSGSYVKQTLLTRLKHDTDNPNLSPIHRLDKETAGLILISKNAATRGLYQSLFASRDVEKIYHAIAKVNKNLTFPLDISLRLERGEPFYTMMVADGEPNSHTHIRCIDEQGDWAKYELRPATGKLHQLRVHLNHLGVPIKNDPYYPKVQHKAAGDFSKPLQLLAYALGFIDPITGEKMAFESGQRLEF